MATTATTTVAQEGRSLSLDAELTARKDVLELEKLTLENERARKELNSFGHPTRWEVVKSLVTFFGVLLPAFVSIFTFLHQRDVELAQKQQELRADRLRAIERARND